MTEHLIGYALGTCTLTPNCNFIGITSKSAYILSNPLQSKPLVQETRVTRSFFQKIESLKESPDAQTVIQAHSDYGLADVLAYFDNS
jgi:hypothetical protein